MKYNYNAGTKFGHWTVLFVGVQTTTENNRSKLIVQCECVCGVRKCVDAYSLRSGRSKSCGCRGNISKISNTTIYRNLTRANNISSVENLSYNTTANIFVAQNGLCAVTNTTLDDSNAKLERINNNLPFTPTNVAWVNAAITPITQTIGVGAAKILSSSQQTNIFQNLGMQPVNTTGDTHE